jgi:peptidylprolyl isomerase
MIARYGFVLFAALLFAGAGQAEQWQSLDPANTVIMTLPQGEVIIELNPTFAPKTAGQFRRLVKSGFYQGQHFYRVIDGFVAQGGDGSDMSETENAEPSLPAEFERAWIDSLPWTPVQKDDLYAPETGFVDGFPAARDSKRGRVWLTHCPGAVAMARSTEPDTGSTDFYIVIGQAPRYLDRNLTIFGRVVSGMEFVQQIQRGPSDSDGMIESPKSMTPIQHIAMLADQTAEERATLERVNTDSDWFRELLNSRRNRSHEFFHHTPPAVLDVCQQPLKFRRVAVAAD